jgi:peptidyl-tRNA hydrolase
MKDHNSAEAIKERSSQEDPIVMYLIVRESLGMSIGKSCAQCAHASQMLQLKFNELEAEDVAGWSGPTHSSRINIFKEWLDRSYRKVVLKANDNEWHKIKGSFVEGHNFVVVVDAGLTEIAAGSETVIGLWPMRKSEVPKVVKKLQALK